MWNEMIQLCSECASSIKPNFNKNKKLQLKFTSFRSWFFHYDVSLHPSLSAISQL